VSHELKTPISVLQVNVEALFDVNKFSQEHLEKILDMQHTLQKIKKTVNALLLMSKVNNQQFLLTEKVDVQKVISELIDEWNDIALDKGLQLEWQDKGSCILEYSNSSLFEVMVRNAISNAVKYSYPNEKIIIASGFVKQEFYCSILNKGELITEDMLFQVKAGRVFLKDVSTDKSGFGLQIMFKVASYLGFSMEIISSKEEGNEIIFRQIISK
jgi:signal transduction histidine kinase